jgi:hypothetical protein
MKVAKPREVNAALRDAIAGTGLSYDAMARSVRRIAAENGEILATSKSAVAHWVAGTEPGQRTAVYSVISLYLLPGPTFGLPTRDHAAAPPRAQAPRGLTAAPASAASSRPATYPPDAA